jgi:hypothetical protein
VLRNEATVAELAAKYQLTPEPYLTPGRSSCLPARHDFRRRQPQGGTLRGRTYRALRQDRSVDSGAGFSAQVQTMSRAERLAMIDRDAGISVRRQFNQPPSDLLLRRRPAAPNPGLPDPATVRAAG